MTALRADVPRGRKVGVIELHDLGAVFLLFDRSDMTSPERDYLQDDIDMAKRWGERLVGVRPASAFDPNQTLSLGLYSRSDALHRLLPARQAYLDRHLCEHDRRQAVVAC